MRLLYKIEFNSTHYYYCDIINEIITFAKINASAKLYDGYILIDINEEPNVIEEFFIILEQKLPISVFVGKSEVIENFDESLEPIKKIDSDINISFSNDKILEILKNDDGRYREHFESINEKDIILNDESFYKSPKNKEEYVLFCNITKISEYFEINQKQMQLLSAIERPLVKLNIKYNKNLNNEISKNSSIYVRFAKSVDEIILSQGAKLNNIDFLIATSKKDNMLKMMYNENDNIILKGSDELFPRYDLKANKIYNTYEELITDNGSVFKVTLNEYSKRTVSSMNVDFSLSSKESGINVYVPTIGEKKIIKIPNIYLDIDNIFEEISNIDDNCARLISNYTKKFPIVQKKLDDANGIEAIIKVLCKILDLNSVEEFEDLALKSNLKSGLKVDMKIAQIDGVNYLDYRRVIQSIMSYKMADVAANMLCYSFYESLVDLITENVTKIETELKTKDIVITGDLISNPIFFEKIKKNLKTYNIIISKSYPISN